MRERDTHICKRGRGRRGRGREGEGERGRRGRGGGDGEGEGNEVTEHGEVPALLRPGRILNHTS